MADDRPLVEQLLDVALFAPIGAIAIASEQVPTLVAKGRATLEGRVTVARMLGRVAVATARRKVSETVESTWPSTSANAPDRDAPDGAVRSSPSARSASRPGTGRSEASGDRAREVAEAPAVGTLAIPGYDSLAASHVVQRLAGLTQDELEHVRRYELATRARRTILGRIAQLQGDTDAGD